MRGSRLKSALTHGSTVTGLGLAVSAIGQLLANLVIVAFAAPATYADIAVLTIAVTTSTIGVRLGTDRMFVGEVQGARVSAGADAEQTVGARLLSGAAVLSLAAGVIVILGPGAAVLDLAVTSPLTGPERWLVGIWIVADSFRLVLAEAHRARHRFVLAAVAGTGLRAPLFLALVVGTRVLTGTVTRTDMLVSAAFASVGALLATLPVATRAYPWWRHSPFHLARGLSDHLLVVLNTLAASAIGGIDVWIVGNHFGSSDTAAYAFSVTMVASLALVSASLSGGLAPRLAALLAAGRTTEAQELSVRFVRWGTLFVVVGYVVLVGLVQPLAVRLGGPSYSGVTRLVVVLGLGQVIATAAGISGWLLVYSRRYRESTLIVTSAAVVAIALEWGLASAHLLLLTATASALATAGIHVLSNLVAQRRIGLRTDVFVTRTPLQEERL